MPVLVIRHGLSKANDRGSAAFGSADAELMDEGVHQARLLRATLSDIWGVKPSTSEAATSKMSRAVQTAKEAGFLSLSSYASLNEVDVPKTPEFRAVLDRHEIMPEARLAARELLSKPPKEEIWFTHGYLIAALCEETEIDTTDLRFIPRFCEIRELPI